MSEMVFDQPLPFAIFDDFLSGADIAALLDFTLTHEGDFGASGVVDPERLTTVVKPEYRRSRCLFDLGSQFQMFSNRIESNLGRILGALDRPIVNGHVIETALVASNDGEYFRHHIDNGSENLRTRQITFVYYFHREPKAFDGGELRIYTSYVRSIVTRTPIRSETIAPLQNRMVVFPSSMMHEVLPVKCPSHAFADSRFSVTGWIHRMD